MESPDPAPETRPPGTAPRFQGYRPANTIFIGPHGIRAGWRLLIFIVLFRLFAGLLMHPARPGFSVRGVVYLELALFGSALAASGIMALLERRSLADYGLPMRGAFGRNFWEGSLWGLVALTVVLLVLKAAGNMDFGTMSINGWRIAKYGAMWGVAFLLVGLAEEYLFRGYPLFTLTTGMTFWPSAVLLSIVFGAVHLDNPGETWMGGLIAALIGLFFCFTLRRTGSLWFAIGTHMGWDWGETFLYGVPNSGQTAPGHLLNASFEGSKWITGGSVGPEGSMVTLIVILLMFVGLNGRFRQVRFPRAAALPETANAGPSSGAALEG